MQRFPIRLQSIDVFEAIEPGLGVFLKSNLKRKKFFIVSMSPQEESTDQIYEKLFWHSQTRDLHTRHGQKSVAASHACHQLVHDLCARRWSKNGWTGSHSILLAEAIATGVDIFYAFECSRRAGIGIKELWSHIGQSELERSEAKQLKECIREFNETPMEVFAEIVADIYRLCVIFTDGLNGKPTFKSIHRATEGVQNRWILKCFDFPNFCLFAKVHGQGSDIASRDFHSWMRSIRSQSSLLNFLMWLDGAKP